MRITPACAGKRLHHRKNLHNVQDHPRVCGEKFSKSTRKRSGIGSPPRVRGKVLSIPAAGGFAGITPACAGKRYEGDADKLFPHGSPPRVRGKVCALSALRLKERITPACAGKSCSASWTVNLRQRITPACAGKSTEVFQN